MVFVYGTLRRGGVRAISTLFPKAEDRGPAVVRGLLVDFGAYPGLELSKDLTDHRVVHGELYAGDAATLQRLDEIEVYKADQPERSYYLRVRAEVTMAAGETVEAWTYEYNPALLGSTEVVSSGDWITHLAAKSDVPPERWPDGRRIER